MPRTRFILVTLLIGLAGYIVRRILDAQSENTLGVIGGYSTVAVVFAAAAFAVVHAGSRRN